MSVQLHSGSVSKESEKQVVYYAPGGGNGHFTRAIAFLSTLHIKNAVIVVTSVPHEDIKKVNGHSIILIPEDVCKCNNTFSEWFDCMLHSENVSTLIVDSFPYGIKGELNDINLPEGTDLWYVARYVRWDVYGKCIQSQKYSRFSHAFIVEVIHEDQKKFVTDYSAVVTEIALKDPEMEPFGDWALLDAFILKQKRPVWLLVHSGSLEECIQLFDYAITVANAEKTEPVFALCGNFTGERFENYPVFNLYPVCNYFSRCNKVVSGGGYNSVRQLTANTQSYNILPFERYYDDQFFRVSQMRRFSEQRVA